MIEKVEGLAALDLALGELPKSTARATLRRAGLKALEPFVQAVKDLAPVDADAASTPERAPGTYRDSWHTGTRLNKNQAKTARREGKSFVEVYAGTSDPLGVLLEFGTGERVQKSTGKSVGAIAPQPHGRPAFEATKGVILEGVKSELVTEIDKAAARLAKKAARRT